MPYLKLMKLLYLADRRAIELYGSPITFDSYVSMKRGPVLSTTLDIIKSPPEPESHMPGVSWNEHICREGYDVVLQSEPRSVLSPADVAISDEVFAQYGAIDQWELADLTHTLPEWRDPGNGALPLEYEDILAALGVKREIAEETLSRLRTQALLEDYARNN